MRRARRRRSHSTRNASRRTRKSLALVFALVFAVTAPRARAACVEFSVQPAINAPDGPVSVVLADVDGDGDLDALSASYADIAWYQNAAANGDGSSWVFHAVATDLSYGASVFAADVDGDGDLDALSAAINDDTIAWYENDHPSGNGSSWSPHVVSNAADGATAVMAADVDGDGHLDVLSAAFAGNKVAWHKYVPGTVPTWYENVISTGAGGANSVWVADVDGDGDLDVLSASWIDSEITWYENDHPSGNGSSWSEQVISTGTLLASSVSAGDLDGDGDPDVLSASYQDNKIAWYEYFAGTTPTWIEHVISAVAGSARSVYSGDVDGDGDLDVLSASGGDDKVAWYENDGTGGTWTLHSLWTLVDGARTVFAGDVDGDGDLDALSASIYSDQVFWFRNERLHGEALFAPMATIATTEGAIALVAADVDGDGDLDALAADYDAAAILWYESDGTGTSWTPRTISNAAAGAYSVVAADVDGDGDLDVLSASFGDDMVAWYENDGTSPPTLWTPHEIAIAMNGARTVFAADVDGDGDTDALSASAYDDKLAWHENRGSVGTVPVVWSNHLVSTAGSGMASVFGADVDDDGDLDLLSASATDNTIAWFENDGTTAPTIWTLHEISIEASNARSVFAADVNGDGDLDVLSASASDGTIAWYENDGATLPTIWTLHEISTSAAGAQSVFAADIDADGDLDALSASRYFGKLAWYENDGTGALWTEHELLPQRANRFSVFAADVDGDGNLDVLSASYGDDVFTLHRNPGTHVHDDGFDSDGATTACWSNSVPPVP